MERNKNKFVRNAVITGLAIAGGLGVVESNSQAAGQNSAHDTLNIKRSTATRVYNPCDLMGPGSQPGDEKKCVVVTPSPMK